MIRLIKYVFFFILFLFAFGLVGQAYEGDELSYNSTLLIVEENATQMEQGVGKIADGTLQITYEVANVIGISAKNSNIDVMEAIDISKSFFIFLIVLAIIWFLGKLLIYGYILIGEFKSQKKGKLELEILRRRNKNAES